MKYVEPSDDAKHEFTTNDIRMKVNSRCILSIRKKSIAVCTIINVIINNRGNSKSNLTKMADFDSFKMT